MTVPEDVQKLLDTFGRNPSDIEQLDPALRLYCEEVEGMTLLRHPLVYQVPFFSWKLANDVYQSKMVQSKQTHDAKEWNRHIALYERPHRLSTLIQLYRFDLISPAELNELLSEWWTDTEFPHTQQHRLVEIFREAGFVSDERPRPTESLTIYRGQREGDPPGMSWTLSLGRARWFAKRWKKDGEKGVVLAVHIPPDVILGLFDRRNEEEVVVDPLDLLKYEVKQLTEDALA